MRNIKEKVKAKVAKAREKVKAKVGKAAKCCSVLGAIVLVLAEVGCMDTNPASRATNSTDEIGDILVRFENCSNCTGTVNLTKGDSALASADSSGSTETQTATPTNTTDIRPQTDVNTTGGRSAGVLESMVGAFGTWLATPSGKAAAESAAACPDGKCATGNCTTGNCADGSCTDGSCTDGSCSDCTLKQ